MACRVADREGTPVAGGKASRDTGDGGKGIAEVAGVGFVAGDG